MSKKIDPREVLVYLNELGYTNITAQQLKEFIVDLKKLLKYESRYGVFPEGASRKQCFCPEANVYCECETSGDDNGKVNSFNKENQAQAQFFSKETEKKETKIEKEGQRDKHIAVHIFDTKNQKKTLHDHCVHIKNLDNANTNADIPPEANKLVVSHMVNTGTSVASESETTESTTRSIRPSSTREYPSRASSKERKSKVTFIRPATSRPSINKSDPVALYHYYQSEWKRTKIPGQDHRDDLRWAIRERMLSGPRVEVKSRCSVQRCGWR